jgi:predicted Zn-ribbon and HTH transcriptional regulator
MKSGRSSHWPITSEDKAMSMKEYRCRDCGQLFQIVELPGEARPAPLQCPACQSESLESMWAYEHAGTPPPDEPPE